MRKKNSPEQYGQSADYLVSMRTPFTADVPGEYSYEAEWLPELRTLPDASKEIDPCRTKHADPLGYITSRR
jgi:hypothetical protein